MDKEMKSLIIRVIISLLLFLLAFFSPDIGYAKLGLYILSYLTIGFNVIKEAFENLIHGEFLDENFLMFIATIGAFVTGEYPEAVFVMLLYEIGEGFEDFAVDKTRDSITELMDIRPDYANIEKDGVLQEVSPQEINIGDIILVKPGEKIPLDGKVIEGESLLDVSALTGESAPQKVLVGSQVFSGTINKNSMIKIKVTKKYEDSTVSKILELVENANDKKAKTEKFITKFAKYYTPIVVVLACMLAFLPPIFIKDASLLDYVHRACSFLVISCPCALVISIPLGFFGGLGGASKQGILIKGSNYLESITNLKTVVFDKTGTLTHGSFEVSKVVSNSMPNDEFLKLAAYAENYSKHPIALSIKKAYGKTINGNLVSNCTELHGNGLEVNVEGKIIDIGNAKLMQSISAKVPEIEDVGTIIYMAIDKQYAGYLVISDTIKEESHEAIKKLNQKNINTIMLTGDNLVVANDVAKKLGIKNVYAELLPDEKVEKLEEIIKIPINRSVAFVGDGINDAPVLTRADVGFAMGGLGSDAAIEASDVVIMDDDIKKINTTIKIAKRTLRIVKQNIVFAISVKLIVLLLSAFGISNMWEAVFADVGVAILAILNSVRALNVSSK